LRGIHLTQLPPTYSGRETQPASRRARRALLISAFTIVLALAAGGIVHRLLLVHG
jgi:hypothetical protein